MALDWDRDLRPALYDFADGDWVDWDLIQALIERGLVFVKRNGKSFGLTHAGKAWVGQGPMYQIHKGMYGWTLSVSRVGRSEFNMPWIGRRPYTAIGHFRSYEHAWEEVEFRVQKSHEKWGEVLPELPIERVY